MNAAFPLSFATLSGVFFWALSMPFAAVAQELKPRLTTEELNRRLTHLLQTEGRPAFDDIRLNAQPGRGVFVTGVKENSVAARLGLKKGDLVTHFAGYPWWANRMNKRLPQKGDHTFGWASPGGQTFKEAASIDFGINTTNFFRPENIYANERTVHSVEWNE